MPVTKRLTLRPNAKLNLGLRVGRRRKDGYHDLETSFIPLRDLCDQLEVEVVPGEGECTMEVHGLYDSGPVEENLVYRAYHSMLPYRPPSVRVRLEKRIPVGAGLGGGSADAAFFLQGMAPLCGRELAVGELEALALGLGSDCPFFLSNEPCYATGRGEVLRPLQVALRAWMVVLVPAVRVSTRWAFGQLGARSGGGVSVAEALALPKSQWQTSLRNDFLPVIQSAFPEVEVLLARLRAAGAYYTSLSGSGPAVYGLYDREVQVAGALWSGWWVWGGRPTS